jgi:hypothetical protein
MPNPPSQPIAEKSIRPSGRGSHVVSRRHAQLVGEGKPAVVGARTGSRRATEMGQSLLILVQPKRPSVALVQQVLACGGAVGGVRLLSEAGYSRVLEEQADGKDLVMNLPMRWGLGYCIGSPLVGKIYGQRAGGRRLAFWGGSGGSWAINDLDARMTVRSS